MFVIEGHVLLVAPFRGMRLESRIPTYLEYIPVQVGTHWKRFVYSVRNSEYSCNNTLGDCQASNCKLLLFHEL